MDIQAKTTRYKIDFAGASEKSYGVSQTGGNGFHNRTTRAEKFPKDHSFLSTHKGQLFIIAELKAQQQVSSKIVDDVIKIIQENYFSYPSDDVAFSLQRAFDIANRQMYQYAKTYGLHKKVGITCSALVLKDKYAYIAHVGDARIYHVNLRKITQLTQDHTRIIEYMAPTNGKGDTQQDHHKRSVVTKALGIQLGIKIDTIHRIPIHRDEYFLLATQGIKVLKNDELKNIVLSSSPQNACQKITRLVEERTDKHDTVVQIVKIYNYYEDVMFDENGKQRVNGEPNSHSKTPQVSTISTRWSFLPLVITSILFIMVLMFLFFKTNPIKNLPHHIKDFLHRYELMTTVEVEEASSWAMEQMQLATAREYLAANKLDKAEKIFSAILKAHGGKHPQARMGLEQIASKYQSIGNRYRRQGNWKRALSYFKAARRLNPNAPGISILISQAQRKINQAQRQKSSSIPSAASLSKIEPPATRLPVIKPPRLLTRGFQPTLWRLPGLDERLDYEFRGDTLIFYDNIRIKKAFFAQTFDSVEVEVHARLLLNLTMGSYGIIFGHQPYPRQNYRHFYLFSIQPDSRYELQQVTPDGVRVLVSGQIAPGVQGGYKVTQLKVKTIGKLVVLYVNGITLYIKELDQVVKGGVGLYVDPKLRVQFTNFKILPSTIQ
ncbi:MAG: hypothetical protein D6748_09945 [Calditrichaeota bacterium]|nr:MAG: hypothetical protein D6748_09945 [Calditrichota bacterium]